MIKTGAEIVFDTLEEEGVTTIFGYPGGAVLPLYDALYSRKNIDHILVNNEQGAAFAAQGYSRVSKKVGVVLVTSGPGVANTVTGIADAYGDSIPMVVICGQVSKPLIGTDAFQEVDIVSMTSQATKINYQVRKADDLYPVLKEAFALAKSGHPGPVLVDIPKDVQQESTKFIKTLLKGQIVEKKPKLDKDKIAQVVQYLLTSKKPLLYVGGGLKPDGEENFKLLEEILALINIPVANSLMGNGMINTKHPQTLRSLGMHGTYEANMAFHECDFAFAIGARFSDRTTGSLSGFMPQGVRAHVDIAKTTLNKIVDTDIAIQANALDALQEVLRQLKEKISTQTNQNDLKLWWDQINKWKEKDSTSYEKTGNNLKQQDVILEVARMIEEQNISATISTDVGKHQMHVAQLYPFSKPRQFLTSGALGTMGFGVPTAMGAAVLFRDENNNKEQVICFSGDGSIMMNIQELATLGHYNIPVKTVVLNNACLGMVYQWQDIIYDKRFSQTIYEKQPDFVTIAKGCNVEGEKVESRETLTDAIQKMLDHDGPYLLDVYVDRAEHIMPMIPAGASQNELILREDLQK